MWPNDSVFVAVKHTIRPRSVFVAVHSDNVAEWRRFCGIYRPVHAVFVAFGRSL